MYSEICPVCLQTAEQSGLDDEDVATVDCPQCGLFRVTFEAKQELLGERVLGDKYSRARANISGWLNQNRDFLLETDTIDALALLPTPDVLTRVDRVMAALEKDTTFIGQKADLKVRRYMGVSCSINPDELVSLLIYLQEKGWIKTQLSSVGEPVGDTLWGINMTPAGWIHLDENRRTLAASSQGFVAMWFDKALDDAYLKGFQPAIHSAGYDPVRMDRIEHLDMIDDRTIAEIRRSRFLVADLTGHSGGVYYEAGFATGLALPVIWTCREDDRKGLHFDIRQYNCIFWDTPDTLRDKLRHRIESVLGRGPRAQTHGI